jgi:malonate-semialdehyde dehydrogenase (acetylating) / methylmalonate-semialdehyde dehydrogenase
MADCGPLATKSHLDKVKAYVDLGIKEGAKLLVDGRDFKMQGYENGFYMGSCLFDEVKPQMRIYREEIFGPVLSVVRAKTYTEALTLANDHEYGNGVSRASSALGSVVPGANVMAPLPRRHPPAPTPG